MAEILNLELKWFLYQTLILVQKWDLTRFNMVLKLCLPLINQIWILLTNFYGATSNYGPIKIPTTPGPPWWPQLAVRLLICQGTLSRGLLLRSKAMWRLWSRLRAHGSNNLFYMSVSNCGMNMNKFYAHLMYFFVIYSCKYENAGFTWTTHEKNFSNILNFYAKHWFYLSIQLLLWKLALAIRKILKGRLSK